MKNINKFIIFDGGMGTMLQDRGLKTGELPETLNITDPDIIEQIYKEYIDAGAEILTTNTFGANSRKIKDSLDEIITAGVKIAKKANPKYVALDIGPIGALLKPMGTMSFNEAYDLFKEQVIIGKNAGADIILIETMSDLLEAKAAVLAAKENSNLPVFVTMTFAEDGRTFLGTSPEIAAVTLSGLGVDAIGINCSLGPKEILPMIEKMVYYTDIPTIVQPNAGLPIIENGKAVYTVKPEEFAEYIGEMAELGVTIFGGCCGTTPEYIQAIRKILAEKKPYSRKNIKKSVITSGQNIVILDNSTAVIGERINPTGKKKLKEALKNKDFDYIIGEAIRQQEAGADILDINAGLPDIDEVETLKTLVGELQGVTALPLQIDSSDPSAIEAAVRVYSGKPIINSVNGKSESMEMIFPIVKKYGASVVALTLDESGIPDTAEGRLKIAEKILKKALEFEIPRESIFVDCLVLTASTNQKMVMETLKAVKLVKDRLGLKTVLGVSNVSFGLPNREIINSTFLSAAFGAGLDMPILNPLSKKYMEVVDTFKVLNNEDNCSENFIKKYSLIESKKDEVPIENEDIKKVIICGYKGKSADITRKMLETYSPLDIINKYFIPALNIVGEKFEKGEMFLPQLMASAETVKYGFDVIRDSCKENIVNNKGKIILATVKGDIHDIGKNIVKMLLQNYGYDVVDLGRDVEPELIVETAIAQNIKLIGLSALMTTTVRSMEETIKQLRNANVDCKIMVGGAVLNDEYAKLVKADYYAKDAAESAKIAEKIFNN